MARSITALRILIGYPDDVAEERDVLEGVVEELNRIWSHSIGYRIELIDWKTHSWPNFGTDSQAVINTEVGEDYDIFLGIMWMKFGEPTPRAGSGTAEEFNRALDRFKRDSSNLRIMFYFKNAAPQALEQIDPEQLKLVREFKKRVADEGGLYHEFVTTEQFASALRLHLTRQAEEYGKSWGIGTNEAERHVSKNKIEQTRRDFAAVPARVNTVTVASEEEEGFLDLIERSVEELAAAAGVLGRITEAQTASTQQITERTAEINRLNMANAEIGPRKRAFNAIANSMDEYSSTLEEEVPTLSQHYSAGVDAFTRATSIWSEDFGTGRDQLETGLKQLESMLNHENEYLTAITSVREVISSMPRVTSDFNRSKRRLLLAIDALMNEVQREMDLGNQLLGHVTAIVDDANGELN